MSALTTEATETSAVAAPATRRVALVSGGSRGIGAATVLRLAQDGWDVAFCYRSDEEAARQVEKAAGELGARVLAIRADVASAAETAEFVRRTEAELGPIHAAVSCAGITRDKPLALMADEDWRQVMDTNLDGVFHLCRAAVFPMIKRRSGTLITLSSVSGVHGNVGQANYSAAKAGLIGLTKALAKEVGRYGIRANAVAPGLIDTDMTAALAAPARARLLGSVPLGRFGTAREVADLIAFLASDQASYITGSVLEVHGGISL
jgi:3-oxoacyl-[acyl-carrier protein] reductase